MLAAKKISEVITSGSSMPLIVVADDGKKYVSKLACAMSSNTGAISEWIMANIANEINLPVLPPGKINIDNYTYYLSLDIEKREMIQKSFGANICYEYLPNAKFDKYRFERLDSSTKARIFIFDCIVLNVDRSNNNPNLMFYENKCYSVDYEVSFLVHGLIRDKDYDSTPALMNALRSSPIYTEDYNYETVDALINRIKAINIESIISKIAKSWFAYSQINADALKRLLGLKSKMTDRSRIMSILERIKSITPESSEEIKARQDKAKQDFLNRINK